MFDVSATLLLLLAVFLGAVLTLTGAALGGLLVFRTRKEPHESLFRTGPEKGEAFVVDDLAGGIEEAVENRGGSRDYFDPFPKDIIAKQNAELLAQLKDKKEAGRKDKP